MTETVDWEPCPFCGNENPSVLHLSAGRCCVHCWDCQATSGIRPTEAEAVATWQNRVTYISVLGHRIVTS